MFGVTHSGILNLPVSSGIHRECLDPLAVADSQSLQADMLCSPLDRYRPCILLRDLYPESLVCTGKFQTQTQ